jgi:hypothetical protein
MEGGIAKEQIAQIAKKIRDAIEKTFFERGYKVFDYSFIEKPSELRKGMKPFWGGYHIEFKVVEIENYNEADMLSTRNKAFILGSNEKKAFSIDISKCDYCSSKQEHDIDGYTVFVYSPEMVVIEKIRAICQKMPEYPHGYKSARARDFYDIYILMEKFGIDLSKEENLELFKLIFGAKEVPLSLILNIGEYREYHRADFPSVVATVISPLGLEQFDFYFDYVVKKTETLKILWEV